jgi:NAD(P)H-hydrate epimerase
VSGTDGTVPGPAVDADTTLTLALPKTGLGPNAGDLLLGDIAIPQTVFDELDIPYRDPFGSDYVVPIRRNRTS